MWKGGHWLGRVASNREALGLETVLAHDMREALLLTGSMLLYVAAGQ